MDLDRQRMVGAGTDHDGNGRHPLEVGRAEPVEKGLEEAGVTGLEGGRREDHDPAPPDCVDGLPDLGRGPVEEKRAEVGKVHHDPRRAVNPHRAGHGISDGLRHLPGSRPRLGVPNDDSDRARGVKHVEPPIQPNVGTICGRSTEVRIPGSGLADVTNGIHRSVCGQTRRRGRPLVGRNREADVDVERRVALDQDVPTGVPKIPGRLDVGREIPVGAEA